MTARRTNEEWLSALRSTGPEQESALADLRAVLLAGLPYALQNWLSPAHPQFDELAEEVVQDSLLRILDRLDSFEGRSQFTTWAHKVAVRLALTELRRRKWRDVSLEELVEENHVLSEARLQAASQANPAASVEQLDAVARVVRIIREELTDRQRKAILAMGVRGMPLEEVARRLDSNRGALYKLLHDARLRLKRRMEAEGLPPDEILALFDRK